MAGIIDFIVPREKKFFEKLQEQSELLSKSIGRLKALAKTSIKDQEKREATLKYILKQRAASEKISQEIVIFLHQTFITPIDRSDIKSLTFNINRVFNSVKNLSESLCFFKIDKIDSCLQKQITALQKASQTLIKIFDQPLRLKENSLRIKQIRKIENRADDCYRRGVEYLFTNGHKPLEVIKQRELYETAERAIDKIENLADIWESVLINHA